MWLLFNQLPFLVGAAVGTPLVHLRARGGAGTRVFEHQSAVPVDEGEAAVAVLVRLPLVILGRAERPLDDACALRGGSALDHSIFTALHAVDLVITAVRGDKFPLQVLAGGRRRPLG